MILNMSRRRGEVQVLQHWESVCIKADRCVNSPGFESVVSLLMWRTHCRHECERCPGRQNTRSSCDGLNSKLACSVAVLLLLLFLTTSPSLQFSTVVRKSPEGAVHSNHSIGIWQHPLTFQAPSVLRKACYGLYGGGFSSGWLWGGE